MKVKTIRRLGIAGMVAGGLTMAVSCVDNVKMMSDWPEEFSEYSNASWELQSLSSSDVAQTDSVTGRMYELIEDRARLHRVMEEDPEFGERYRQYTSEDTNSTAGWSALGGMFVFLGGMFSFMYGRAKMIGEENEIKA